MTSPNANGLPQRVDRGLDETETGTEESLGLSNGAALASSFNDPQEANAKPSVSLIEPQIIHLPPPSVTHESHTFDDLPAEMKTHIMDTFLTAKNPITNPWMEFNFDEDEHEYHASGCFAGFNVAVLRVSKGWHILGMESLYAHNVFRFTRCVAAIPGYEMPTIRIQRFLSEQVTKRSMNGLSQIARRSDLIRHIMIQDSDLDSDALAKDGYGRDLSRFTPTDGPFVFTLAVLGRLANLKCRLLTLIINIDEEDPRALPVLNNSLVAGQELDVRPNIDPAPEQLDFEQRKFNYEAAAGITPEERKARIIGWNNVEPEDDTDEDDSQEKDKHSPPKDPFGFCRGFQGLGVVKLDVRGVTGPAEDRRRMQPLGTPVAAVRWLAHNHIKVEKIRFGGAFTKRRLAQDGTLIPVAVLAAAPVTAEQEDSGTADENEDDIGLDGDDQGSQTTSQHSDDTVAPASEGVDVAQQTSEAAQANSASKRVQLSSSCGIRFRARNKPHVFSGNLYELLGNDLLDEEPQESRSNSRNGPWKRRWVAGRWQLSRP